MKKEDVKKWLTDIAKLSESHYQEDGMLNHIADICFDFASQSKPQLNIEKVVSGIVDSLGETSKGNDYQIHSIRGERWITHNEVGSGEPLKQWLKSEIEKHIEQSKPQEIEWMSSEEKKTLAREVGNKKMSAEHNAYEGIIAAQNLLQTRVKPVDTKTVDAVDALIVLTFDRHGHISGVNAPDKVVIMKTLEQFAESGYNGNFDNDSYYTLESVYIESKK